MYPTPYVRIIAALCHAWAFLTKLLNGAELMAQHLLRVDG